MLHAVVGLTGKKEGKTKVMFKYANVVLMKGGGQDTWVVLFSNTSPDITWENCESRYCCLDQEDAIQAAASNAKGVQIKVEPPRVLDETGWEPPRENPQPVLEKRRKPGIQRLF